MRVSETLELSIPDEGLDDNRLERYLAREVKEFGKPGIWEGIAGDTGEETGGGKGQGWSPEESAAIPTHSVEADKV